MRSGLLYLGVVLVDIALARGNSPHRDFSRGNFRRTNPPCELLPHKVLPPGVKAHSTMYSRLFTMLDWIFQTHTAHPELKLT